jgi:hypothetical protein
MPDQDTEHTFRRKARVCHRSAHGAFGSVLGVVRNLQGQPLVVVQWERGHVGCSRPAWLERLSAGAQ